MEGIFDKLEREKGSPLTNKEKENVLKYLETPKNEEGVYVDSFGNQISYNGIKTLKRPYTKLSLTQDHINEIQKCSEDLFYFVKNYCRIITPTGLNFPEFRQYQMDFLKILDEGKDTVASLPRQCVDGGTKIKLDGIMLSKTENNDVKIEPGSLECSIKGLFELSKKMEMTEGYIKLENNNPEYIESHILISRILTDKGFIEAAEIHKTVEFDIYEIELENGLKLKASEKHVIIDKDYNEVYIKDCLGKEIITEKGISKVISKKHTGRDNCYDLTLKEHHLYYSNGILSHNSGKSVTTALYLLHYSLFNKNKYIGICANKLSLATEVLDKIKKIFIELPIWMQQGIMAWNKTFIEFENGTKIMTAAANGDAFRGYSCIHKDEILEVYDKDTRCIKRIKIFDLYNILKAEKNINKYKIKTPNGFEYFEGIKKSSEKDGYKFTFADYTTIKVSKSHLFKHNDSYIKAEDLKIFDVLQDKKIFKIDPIISEFYEPVEVENHEYICSGLIHHNCNKIVIDECVERDSIITIKYKYLGITQSITIGDLYNRMKPREFLIKEITKLNPGNIDLLIEYVDFCLLNSTEKLKYETDNHHILPKSYFPEFTNTKENYGFQVLTENGYKDFDNIKESTRTDNIKITFEHSFIIVTPEHKFYNKGSFIRAKDIREDDIINNKKVIKIENNVSCSNKFYDLINVEDGHHYTANNIEVSNCSFVSGWQEIVDSLLPSQAALADRQLITLSTPNGMNHWYHLVQKAQKENSGYNFFTMDWRDVPRFNKAGNKIDPEDFKLEQISKNGKQFFAQNYELAFLGSSDTLIDSNALQNLTPLEENKILLNTLFYGLRILEESIPNHNYIIGVDPSKEGIDKTAIQVLDVTSLPFKLVASANLDDSYLTIPSKLFDLGVYYNEAMVVVENNIDNSIVDNLLYNYEYEGEIYKERNKNILGFRTTVKSKKQMLSLLKKLIEESKLDIADRNTIDELFVFVQQKNGSFSAQDGYHDDLVMALCMCLVPFLNVRNFDDFKGFIQLIEKRREDMEKEAENNLNDFLNLGFSTEVIDNDFYKSDYQSNFVFESNVGYKD